MDDLAVNRVSRLSSHQTWDAVREALGMAGVLLIALGALMTVAFVVKTGGLLKAVYVGLALVALITVAVVARQSIGAALAPRVVVNEGPLDLHGTGRGVVAVIGASRVNMPVSSAEVLTSGASYRIFSLAGSNMLLSIEPLSEAGGPAP